MNKILADIYNELKHQRRVKTKEDFAKQMGYNRSYVSVLFGSDTITDKVKAALVRVYAINPTFVESGKGDMFSTKPKEPTSKLDVLVETVQILANSVAQDRETVKHRLEELETSSATHGKVIESLLEWKNLADDTFEEIAAQLKPLTDAAQRRASVVAGGSKRGSKID